MEIQEINTLLKSQENDMSEIKRILSNMKKDSPTRKTPKYIEEHRQTLNSIFKRVQENHIKLEDQEIISTHTYITQKFFEAIKRHYHEALDYLIKCEEKLQVLGEIYELKGSTITGEEEKYEYDLNLPKQLAHISELTKSMVQAKVAITENRPVWHLRSTLEKLQQQWEKIESTHYELLIKEYNTEHSYFKNKSFEVVKEDYQLTCELLRQRYHEKSSISDTIKKNIGKLPPINIPIFKGKYEDWSTFQDLFKKIIHEDQSITSVEKMQYLKSHVQGEAARLVQHLPINEVNYDAAWSLLSKRYEDKRMITTTFIDKLLDLPKIKYANGEQLRDMHDTVNEIIEGLKNQGINISTWGPILARIVSRKWDSETNSRYEDQLHDNTEVPNFEELMSFLEKRFKCLKNYNLVTSSSMYHREPLQTKSSMESNTRNFEFVCWYCQSNDHVIHTCPEFKHLTVNERHEAVNKRRKCKRCLNHVATKLCESYNYKRCEICNSKGHNTLLHRTFSQDRLQISNTINTKEGNKNVKNLTSNTSSIEHFKTKNISLLATAILRTTTSDGMPLLVRVLCDQGSEASLCTEEIAQALKYPRTKTHAEIKGIGDNEPKISHYTIDITLQPRHPSEYKLTVTLIVLPKLTGSLPRNDLQQINAQSIDGKTLADPTYYKKGPIDIILGAQEYSKILLHGFERLDDGTIAQNTQFGWILSGVRPEYKLNNGIKIVSMITRTKEVEHLTKFWELEEVSQKYEYTTEDQICENFYKKTTIRNTDGTYTVRLPLKHPKLDYGDTRQIAAARLMQLERKFTRNDKLRKQYIDFMDEYLEMNHMKKVDKKDYGKGKYYIPHQAIIREDALTTKLRVVFDASTKSSTKISLNDNMYKGPRLQQELPTILLRWRMHKVAFMSDIMKMYRFIKINEIDYPYQRILWRTSPNLPIEEYELTTVTYGTASAPYLAMKTLQQLAKDEKDQYPIASQVALQDFYVDDILSGANTVETAKELQTQLINLLRKGGFELRKWSSNSRELLQNIPNETNDDGLLKLPLDEHRKSLGVAWAPREDNFYFQIKVTQKEKPTKRFILSEIAKLFDPLGWLAPIIVPMKLLIQDLWMNGNGWDQPVDIYFQKQWHEIQRHLQDIESITIPRWCHVSEDADFELHGFSDASEKAYGAVIYCRVKQDNEYYVTLLQAKSKVAPRKQKSTLPRLELCAALLMANQIEKIKNALGYSKNIPIYCWTDSMIALGWIKGEVTRWKKFVANRVSEIQHVLPRANWNHVGSTDNPADIISRGIEPHKLKSCELWWNGPQWLKNDKLPETHTVPEVCEEITYCHVLTNEIQENEIWRRFSKFSHMVRVLSYCYRLRQKQGFEKHISCKEIMETLNKILKQIQHEGFQEEIKILNNNKQLKKGNRISTLDPFIDNMGLLRVGGRLQNSQLPYDQKHPILLPYNHYVTDLIIQEAHLKTLHGGNKLTLAYLRQRYWILSGKRKVKSILNKCVKCLRYRGMTASQKMGMLPKDRVTQSYPFSHTGVDFAGPIQVRAMKGRGHKSYKAYIAVFVCLATKAIHLELVGDLSTETFIAALRRFMARRGHVSHIYSDNATNFVGAANFLYEEILEVSQSSAFQHELSNIGTQWHFIPPTSPHFGGIWEAGVKSMKHHLRRVIGDSTLTYEEMTTLLHQIEACLNTRPLCALSEDINDSVILTPSHFLIGREAVGVPDPISNINTDHINRWKLVQKMKKDIWSSWTKDYLHQLQQRYKWKQNQENLKIGTAVLIKDENISPSKWPMAKIKELHAGDDGNIRVVTVQKSNGNQQKRAIHTLIPLPVGENEDEKNKGTLTSGYSHCVNNTKQKKGISRGKNVFGTLTLAVLLVFQLSAFVTSSPTYTLKNIEPGFYIEQIGTATIDRGNFRIETVYQKNNIKQDLKTISTVISQFQKVCYMAQSITYETHCTEFLKHLEDEENKFEKSIEYLVDISGSRKKRGILGNLLTSVFGVNDDVYRDINTLHDNQQKLIEAANHQTKFMISTISTVNQTEERIKEKLERFQSKLNQAIDLINNNNVWYKSTDSNRIKIQVMQTYHLANNYIKEITDYYNGILKICIENATIYSILSPKSVDDIIKTANKKLPTNLRIVQNQLLETTIFSNNTHVIIYAYFSIHDVTKYTLIHVTPIPKLNKDGTFTSFVIQHSFLGFDYNNERYFDLSLEEFKTCLHKNNEFICYPVSVKDMQSNKNCIIEQLFKTGNNIKTQCYSRSFNITSDVLWKQLYMPNTWLFIAKSTQTASIICDGERKELQIQSVGVINISENCVIKTLHNLLAARRSEVKVISSYSKLMNFSASTPILPSKIQDLSKEQIIESSKDIFQHLTNSEKTLQNQLDNTIWAQIQTHTSVTSFGISTALICLALIIYFCAPQIKRCYKTNITVKEPARPPTTSESSRDAAAEQDGRSQKKPHHELIELYHLDASRFSGGAGCSNEHKMTQIDLHLER